MQMVGTNRVLLGLIVVSTCFFLHAARAGESPRATIQSAIKAHGGEKNLGKTLTGTLVATMVYSADVKASITFEETFELPRRYRRSIKGLLMGKDISMEYAITDGSGWIRENGGEPRDYKGEKQPLNRNWTAAWLFCLSIWPMASS
jgi:hypothetical protein